MKKITFVERVLIVLNKDGSLKAAQQESLEQIIDDDGSLIAEKQLGAVPITEDALVGVIGNSQSVLAQNAALMGDNNFMELTMKEQGDTLKELQGKNAALLQSNTSLKIEVDAWKLSSAQADTAAETVE